MTGIPVQHERLDGLKEEELEVIRFALQQVAKRVMDRAAADQYAKEDLAPAAMTFHLASSLAGEFGVKLGEPAPSAESLEMAAGCIAEGDAPLAAGAAAGTAQRLAELSVPLGAHADVPVTPEEDAATAERRYPVEVLDADEDDGMMPENVALLEQAVIGHRIVSAEHEGGVFTLTLDTGAQVTLRDTSDCCAFTDLKGFLMNPAGVDHAILGVGTTEGYTKWHIYADFGDVVEMDVAWSCGNPFYYGYGFDIAVEPVATKDAA